MKSASVQGNTRDTDSLTDKSNVKMSRLSQLDCSGERLSERPHTAEAFWQDTGKKIIGGFYGVAALVAELY